MHDPSGRYGGPLTVGSPASWLLFGSSGTFEPLPFAADVLLTAGVLALVHAVGGTVGLIAGWIGGLAYFVVAFLGHIGHSRPPLVPPLPDYRDAINPSSADLALLWMNCMILALVVGVALPIIRAAVDHALARAG